MSQYLTYDEVINLGCIPSEYVDELDTTDPGIVLKVVQHVSGVFDSYLQKRYETPFQSDKIPDGLKEQLAQVVSFKLYMRRGFNPSSTQDQYIKDLYTEAMDWLVKASKGEIELDRFADQTPDLDEMGPFVYADAGPYTWVDQQKKGSQDECGCGNYKIGK